MSQRGIQEKTREQIAKITKANEEDRDPRNIISRLRHLIRYIEHEEEIHYEILGDAKSKG